MPQRALREVEQVVVDVVEDHVLHPGRRLLHERGVLEGVVGVLDRVEELVRRGRLHRAHRRRGRELGVVVVHHQVRRHVPVPIRLVEGVRVVGDRDAVEPRVRPDLGDVDVDLRVRAVLGRGQVGLRGAEAELRHLDVPGGLEGVGHVVDVVGRPRAVAVGERRCVGRGRHPVEAEVCRARGLDPIRRVPEALGIVGALRRTGQDVRNARARSAPERSSRCIARSRSTAVASRPPIRATEPHRAAASSRSNSDAARASAYRASVSSPRSSARQRRSRATNVGAGAAAPFDRSAAAGGRGQRPPPRRPARSRRRPSPGGRAGFLGVRIGPPAGCGRDRRAAGRQRR